MVRNGCIDRNVQKRSQTLPVGLREKFAISENLIDYDINELGKVRPAVVIKAVS